MAVSVKTTGSSAPATKVGELAKLMAAISKEKPSTLYRGSAIPQPERLATGVFEFDLYTGGGFPKGRISIVYGPESSGKSNLCYCAAAVAQKAHPYCNKVVWVDLEGTFDPVWAARFGVDVDALIVVKPGYGEEAVDLCDALIRADDVALLVVDSVAAVVSSKEVKQSVETMDVQGISTLVKRLCNKFAVALSEEGKRDHRPAVVLLNQTRFKIGVMFGDPETMPGGQTMKFLSSLTVRVYGKNKSIKEVSPDLPVFKETVAVIKKAKVPVLKVEFKYDMTMLAHGDLTVGETDSFNMVKAHLQNHGHLVKGNKGWELLGVVYPTLSVIEDTYRAERSFAMKLQALVIQSMMKDSILVEEKQESNNEHQPFPEQA